MDYGQPGNSWDGYYREQGFAIPLHEMEEMYKNQPAFGEIIDVGELDVQMSMDWIEEFCRFISEGGN